MRTVKPELVFELHFEGIQRSTRHKIGIAVRFPRMARWRTDKKPEEADTIETVRIKYKLKSVKAEESKTGKRLYPARGTKPGTSRDVLRSPLTLVPLTRLRFYSVRVPN